MTEINMDSDATLCRYSFMIGYIEWIGWWIGGRHRSFFFGGWQVKTASKLFGRNSTLNRKFDYNKWDIRNLSLTKVNTHPISHMMLSSNWISPLRTNFHTLRFKPFISSAWAYFTAVTVPMHVHLYFPCIKLKYRGHDAYSGLFDSPIHRQLNADRQKHFSLSKCATERESCRVLQPISQTVSAAIGVFVLHEISTLL